MEGEVHLALTQPCPTVGIEPQTYSVNKLFSIEQITVRTDVIKSVCFSIVQ